MIMDTILITLVALIAITMVIALTCLSFTIVIKHARHSTINIKFKKLHPDAIIPKYAHPTDAGMDLYAIDDYDLIPGVPVLVKTGLAMQLAPGTEAQVRPRSGLALKETITVLNTPGTIDEDYRGEIGVIMISLDTASKVIKNTDGGSHISGKTYHISKGDKIAQMVINKLPKVIVEEVDQLSDTERGNGGFGSTGKN